MRGLHGNHKNIKFFPISLAMLIGKISKELKTIRRERLTYIFPCYIMISRLKKDNFQSKCCKNFHFQALAGGGGESNKYYSHTTL